MPRSAELSPQEQQELLTYLYALKLTTNPDTGKPHTPKEISAVAGAATGWYHTVIRRGGGTSKLLYTKIRKYTLRLGIPRNIMNEAKNQVEERTTPDGTRKPRRRLKTPIPPKHPSVFEMVANEKEYGHLQDKHPDISPEFIKGNIGQKEEEPVVAVAMTTEDFLAAHQALDERLRSLYDDFHALTENAPDGIKSLMKMKEVAFTEFVLTYAGE